MSLREFRVWLLDGQNRNLDREVMIDGELSNRFTGRVIHIEPGHHLISLVAPFNFMPDEQEIVLTLNGLEMVEVVFYLVAPEWNWQNS